MRVLFVDSGLGSLSASSVLRERLPDVDLVLAMDPEFMPWGSQRPEVVVARAWHSVHAALTRWDDVGAVVLACNTASVHALPVLRREVEPAIPVIGTVPAVKPAAVACEHVAVWATPVTAASEYQRALVAEHSGGAQVTVMACDGLAAAIESGVPDRARAAVDHWAAQTPLDATGLVLGSTHYRLVEDMIAAAVRSDAILFDSAEAIIDQLQRRLPSLTPRRELGTAPGRVDVLAGGKVTAFPQRALQYSRGRLLGKSF